MTLGSMMLVFVLSTGLVVAGCASDPMASGAVAGNDNDPSRIVCHNDAPVGSRLPKRVCKSAAEWEAIAEAGQEARRKMQRGAVTPTDAGGQAGN